MNKFQLTGNFFNLLKNRAHPKTIIVDSSGVFWMGKNILKSGAGVYPLFSFYEYDFKDGLCVSATFKDIKKKVPLLSSPKLELPTTDDEELLLLNTNWDEEWDRFIQNVGGFLNESNSLQEELNEENSKRYNLLCIALTLSDQEDLIDKVFTQLTELCETKK